MNTLIKINDNYNSLDKLQSFLTKASSYQCEKKYDIWEIRTDANGQMEQCLVLQKSGMHAVKLYFTNDNTVKVNYVIPNKMMHAYFGKSEKMHKNVIEIIAGVIKQAVLAGPQQKAFDELENIIKKASV